MTRQTFLCERRHISLRSMDVVARGTGHARAGAIAFAAPQEPDLSAVDVRRRHVLIGLRDQVAIRPLARPVRKRRWARCVLAALPQGAGDHLPISRDARGVETALAAAVRR